MTTQSTDDAGWDVKRRITNLLCQRGMRTLRRVDIEFERGTVTLRGTVGSYYERQLCLACSQHVPGVYKLVDEIKVEWPDNSTDTTATA